MDSSYFEHTEDGISFGIPWGYIPSFIPGRFISIDSYTYGPDGYIEDTNHTHTRIDGLGTVSGNISYDAFTDTPIYIQAYLNPRDPDATVVAQTFITEPGPYTLDGIPYGFQGYIRAFTPLFNVDNPFETGEFDVEGRTELFTWTNDLTGIDIDIKYPTILKNGVWNDGELIRGLTEHQWFAFDAIEGGNYVLKMQNYPANQQMNLYSRDAATRLTQTVRWEPQQINWTCPASGRYYLKTDMYYYDGTYQVSMTTDVADKSADIAAPLGTEVIDGNVDIIDLAALSQRWNNTCSYPLWCEKADIDQNGIVSLSDIAELADQWLNP